MDFQLLPIEETDLPIFKHDMQEAFQLEWSQGTGLVVHL